MDNIAVRKVKNLGKEARRVVQELLGRKLREEEEVTVMVFPPHPAPPKALRQAAIRGMEKILDKAATNMKDLPDREFDDAVDEAMDHIRRWKN